MSKFVKVSDVKQTLLEMSKEKTRSVGWGDVLMERLKGHSIEVSEDCISKAYLEQEIENQAMTVEKDKEYWRGWNNALDKVVELIENAPSVVPIAEQYSTDGEVDLGDCNICRFAGCSECDDCTNGSQWVRMTKEDEVEE